MLRRANLPLLVFMVLWLGILMPGHQRGQIKLVPTSAEAHTCCSGKSDPNDGGEPAGNDTGNCAVCYFIAALDLPIPPVLAPTPSESLDPAPAADIDSLASRDLIPTFRGRAPPFAPPHA